MMAALIIGLVPKLGLAYSRSDKDQPRFQAKTGFWQTALDYSKGGWSTAKADLERAGALLEQAAKSASSETRIEIENLDHDIHALFKKYASS